MPGLNIPLIVAFAIALGVIFHWFLLAYNTAVVAQNKGHSKFGWFILCAMFPLLFFVIYILPSTKTISEEKKEWTSRIPIFLFPITVIFWLYIINQTNYRFIDLYYDFMHMRKTEINWTRGKAESLGFDPLKLARLSKGLAARGTRAFLIIRGNRIVHEYYAPNVRPYRIHHTASLAKALVGSLALSVVLDDEALDIDEPVSTYLPSWKDDPNRSNVTIRHLATHTSGLENSDYDSKTNPKDENHWKKIYWEYRPSRFLSAMTKALLIRPPGSEVLYTNPGYSLLSYIVTASLSGSEHPVIYDLFRQRIMIPLEVPDAAWGISYGESYNVHGLEVYETAGGGSFTARAAARIGQLMLQRGSWRGRQLLSPETVTVVTRNAAPTGTKSPSDHPMPGLGWWTNVNGAWPSLPRDAFAGAGNGHQIVLVIPSLDLVVVRFGHALAPNHPGDIIGPYWEPVKEYLFKPLAESVGLG